MPKTLSQYICQQCGAAQAKWAGRCDGCGSWNSLVETAVKTKSGTTPAAALRPEPLARVSGGRQDRFSSGSKELDHVLGGGFVPGAAVLLSGDPGIGKSTLVLQAAARVADGREVLYVSGEESPSQIKLRAERLGLADNKMQLAATTDTAAAAEAIIQGTYGLVIIDSIQTMSVEHLTSGAGSAGQISAAAHLLLQAAKISNTVVMIIGHVTKEGAIAGPKLLEHLVDVVLYLEGERYGSYKALRAVKNRFGSTNEVGIFEMTDQGLQEVADPSSALLAERQAAPGSVVFPAMEGTRPVLVEVQALVSTTVFGYPKRAASGFDLNRLNMLAAVATKRAGLNLSNQDIYVNIVGGLKVAEPAADLAIILAIASAYRNYPVKKELVAFGEVGLSGEIRSVSSASRRIAEAAKGGFTKAIAPPKTGERRLIPVASIDQAIRQALQSAK